MATDRGGSSCDNCGVDGDFCGYHNIGDKGVNLCVACAEEQIDVFRICLQGERYGLFLPKVGESKDTIVSIIGEMDEGDAYNISLEKMSRLTLASLREFQGF